MNTTPGADNPTPRDPRTTAGSKDSASRPPASESAVSGPPAEAPRPSSLSAGTPGRPGLARGGFGWFAAAAVTLLALVGFVAFQVGSATRAPSENSAEAGFARDMQTHHNQAVQMAMTIRDKTSDPTLRAIAYDIATSQQQQAGQMYGWLTQWNLPQTSSEPSMKWMTAGEHQPEDSSSGRSRSILEPSSTQPESPQASPGGGHGMVMGEPTTPTASTDTPATSDTGMGDMGMGDMGMATPAQLRALEHATGAEAERLFLTLMINHHKGGVKMAQAALRLAERPEVRTLAQAIDTAQQAEILQLQQLLQERQ